MNTRSDELFFARLDLVGDDDDDDAALARTGLPSRVVWRSLVVRSAGMVRWLRGGLVGRAM